MEPGPRRRRACRPPVSAFLRDPSSGRVYRRGKLIGEKLRRAVSRPVSERALHLREWNRVACPRTCRIVVRRLDVSGDGYVCGAFSRCYELVDVATRAVFALKVVPRAGGAAGRLRPHGKVEREIALHSRLKHRNIVALHGHFADREHVYLVLEYCGHQVPQGLGGEGAPHPGSAVLREQGAPPICCAHLWPPLCLSVLTCPRSVRTRPICAHHTHLCPSPLRRGHGDHLAPPHRAHLSPPEHTGGHPCPACTHCTEPPSRSDSPAAAGPPPVLLRGASELTCVPCVPGAAFAARGHPQSLAHVLEARRTLTEPEVRYYLRGLVSGLRYLHQRRIVHRDLKPSNFFLSKNMEVKIGDLGLAARVGPGGHGHRVLCGTPNFLAPEVIARNGHSCQSDIWALGCVMYTVLTGAPPFTGAPLSEMYQNIRAGRYPEPAHLSPHARRLIARLLAPNPAERPGLDHLLQDDFFTQGFTPARLPARSCHSAPLFTAPQPLGRLFRKVGALLLTQRRPGEWRPRPACWAGWRLPPLSCRPPARLLRTCAGWTREAGPSAAWAQALPPKLLMLPSGPLTPSEASGPQGGASDPDSVGCGSEASLLDRGALHPEVPVRLLTQGTLRSDPAGPKGSQRQEVEVAIRNLLLCLDHGLPATPDPPGEQRPTLWAPKWVDYFSKYGFGYHLSDGGSGVLLRDGTHMALRPPGDRVSYVLGRGKLETFAPRDVPSPLGAKLAVLRLFARCMQQRLREEGGRPTPAPPTAPGLCLLRFLASERALLLLFSDGTLQRTVVSRLRFAPAVLAIAD
ncbi:inactive serine/threonine-protein kinase PLK5 isoform X3 [Meles meles]|uniref:inactive serine/threonine-protein kinase PLK5 isoform X3 n=1 Tax=Meles meles TaxID=9662 RepID=UPI001E699B42|nr:inactive serine/threonine-protein kinase PLK5 isoform X3 [Meles meles]